MKAYETYKDSGIEWIGEIPSHWDICPLKFNLSLKGRIGWNGLKSDEFMEDSYAYLVTGQDFDKADIDWSKCYQIDKERYDEDPFIQLSNGDLLITKDGTIGKVAKVSNLDKPACLNSGIFVVKQKKSAFIQDFLYWTFVSNQLLDFNNFNSSGSTIQHLYQNVFENMPLLVPGISEQQNIASYLNYKVGRIDAAIKEKEAMLNDLKAYRSAIISEAVTKGLDKNVEMKDSGIEWIGEMPSHWEICALKFNLSLKGRIGWNGLKSDEFMEDSYAYLVTGQDFDKADIDWSKCYQIDKERYDEDPFIQLSNGDLLITKDGTIGKVAKVSNLDKPACLNSGIFVVKQIKSSFIQDFLYWTFVSDQLLDFNNFNSSGSTIQHLYQNVFENMPLLVPSISEQQAIASYLDNKVGMIDSTTKLISSQIEDLKSYKSSIISEAVTGKVDLREWKPRNVTDKN